MATIDLTAETFETTIVQSPIVLVDFWAEWCGPCRRFAPTFTEASEKYPDIVFGKVDTEAERGLAQAANISSIPMLMGFRDGILVFAQPGALPPTGLAEVIDGIVALDMDEIRATMAQPSASAAAQV